MSLLIYVLILIIKYVKKLKNETMAFTKNGSLKYSDFHFFEFRNIRSEYIQLSDQSHRASGSLMSPWN